MRAKSISAFRKDIAADIEAVAQGDPLIVTRTGGKRPVLIVPLDRAGEWDETAYLLSSRKNAERLLRAIRDADSGKGVERELSDE
mgnify:CR=1 FL=1